MIKITVLMILCIVLAYLSEQKTNAIFQSKRRYMVWQDPAYIVLAVVLVLFAGLRTEYNDSLLSS